MTISLADAIANATGVARVLLDNVGGKGKFMTAEWQSIIETPKQGLKPEYEGTVLRKVTRATVRTGIEYKNLSQNIDKETGKLPWGQWVIYPWIITHKSKDSEINETYIRIYMASDFKESNAKYTYYVDGVKVSKAAYDEYLKPVAPRKGAKPDVFTYTVKASNILEIQGTRFD